MSVESARFAVDPFLRSVLMSDRMRALQALQKQCPAYLGLGDKLTELVVLGSAEDQRASLATLGAFAAAHQEEKAEVAVEERLFHLLLEEKGRRLRAIQQDSHARLHMQDAPRCVQVRGLKEEVERAVAAIEAVRAELAAMTEEVVVSRAQLEALLGQKGAALKRLQKEQACVLDVDRKRGVVRVVADEAHRAAALEALAAVLGAVRVEEVALPGRLSPLFVGTKGANIQRVRDASGAQLELEGEVLTISGSEEAVAKAKALVAQWQAEHTVATLEGEEAAVFAVIVGSKGANRRALEQELGVELGVARDGRVTVLGSAERCAAAVSALEAKLAQYARENAVVVVGGGALRNAPELRRSVLGPKLKELGVEYTVQERRGAVSVHGEEEALRGAVAYLEEVASRYAGYEELAVEVPKEELGVLVGRGGENVRSLQSRLGVTVETKGDRVRLWGPRELLEAGKAGVLADLAERVLVEEAVACSVKQVAHLAADRFALANRLQELSGAEVRVPRELPAVGPTQVTVRGNRRQVAAAVPMVREALQGLVREVLALPAADLRLVLEASPLQVARLALEARCRITPSEAEVLVVGPAEGVRLVLRRFWEQLAALRPERYALLPLAENVAHGLNGHAKELAAYAAAHGVTIRHDTVALALGGDAASLPAAREFVEALCERAARENRVVAVGKAAVPFLIGSRGARITALKRQSGAALEILRDEAVLLSGSEEAVAKAEALVAEALEEYKATHRSLQIDPAYIGALVGTRGSNLQRLRSKYLVSVSVGDDGLVAVSGPQRTQVEEALQALQACVEEVKQREAERGAEREAERPRRREVKEETKPAGESVWEKLKRAPLLPPGMSKKSEKKEETQAKEVSRLLGLNEPVVGGSDCYKSETGYTVQL